MARSNTSRACPGRWARASACASQNVHKTKLPSRPSPPWPAAPGVKGGLPGGLDGYGRRRHGRELVSATWASDTQERSWSPQISGGYLTGVRDLLEDASGLSCGDLLADAAADELAQH